MDTDEITEIEKLLSELREPWDSISHETINSLGKEAALHIIEYHGENWINIAVDWIPARYTLEEQNNIIYMQLLRIFKEIFWLQFLFQTGNYIMMYRNLRYILEMMAQAYYVDWNYPSLGFEERFDKIDEMESKIYGWPLVEITLCKIFNCNKNDLDEKYNKIWKYLNKHVHPSGIQMSMVIQEDVSSLYTDSYNENLAKDALEIVDEIFDIVYVLIFDNFPKIKDLALEDEFLSKWESYSPNTVNYIHK